MRLPSALMFSSLCLFAQESAQVTGLVSDPQRAAVPSVAVTMTKSDTAAGVKASTDAGGRYSFSGLQPGKYRIELSKTGFQTAVADDIELHVADRKELNFNLVLGSVSETVTVNGATPLVNTTDGSLSTVVDREFVDNLPMNGRTFQSLITLTPGVLATPAASSNGGQFVVNGMRADDKYFTIDGVSANLGLAGTSSVLSQAAGGQLPALSPFRGNPGRGAGVGATVPGCVPVAHRHGPG